MHRSKRLLVITDEQPFPAIHGGRVDRWNRYRILHDVGYELVLATWCRAADRPLVPEVRTALLEVFDEIYLFKTSLGLTGLMKRLVHLPRHSPHVSSRLLSCRQQACLLSKMQDFGPIAVMLDGIYGGPLAQRISSVCGIPLFLRAHNIEHVYMRQQAAGARTFVERIAWKFAALHLEHYEESLHRNSRWVFEISEGDLAFWRKRGVKHNSWVPFLLADHSDLAAPSEDWRARPYDLVYLGNLYTPNNIHGLTWFVQLVLPHVRAKRASLKILIAGSNPTREIRALMDSAPEVTLIENPPSAAEVWRQGRVLINPILSGSGMNVKSAEMLFFDAWLVTTTIGVQGFSSSFAKEFIVANDARSFGELVGRALQTVYSLTDQRKAARRALGPDGTDRFLADLAGLLKRDDVQVPLLERVSR